MILFLVLRHLTSVSRKPFLNRGTSSTSSNNNNGCPSLPKMTDLYLS